MTLMIYNTMTRKKEKFETLDPGKVRLYVCGPTVYDKAHVGHAMSSIVSSMTKSSCVHRILASTLSISRSNTSTNTINT